MGAPSIGTIVDGYRYAGGDPNDEASWVPSNSVMSDTKTDQETVSKLRDKSAASLATAQAYGRFIDENKKLPTGPAMGIPILPLPKFMGDSPTVADLMLGPFSPAYQHMKSITADQGPKQRPSGSGASSDKDTALYLQGGPRVQNFGTVNQDIYEAKRQESDMDAARSAFMETWFQHKGSLLGGEQAFRSFWAKRMAGDPAANRTDGAGGQSFDTPFGKASVRAR